MDQENPKLLTINEVADVLRLKYLAVYKMIKSQRIESYKIGGSIRVSEKQLNDYLETSKSSQK